jgi:hypothetical protein
VGVDVGARRRRTLGLRWGRAPVSDVWTGWPALARSGGTR